MAEKTQTPTYSQAAKAAGLPTRATTEDIAQMGVVTFLGATLSEARNPQTGEMNPGYVTVVQDDDGRIFRVFIGGVVLKRDIEELLAKDGFPFRARLVRDGEGQGHPWTFND